jgi:hypothetical protein
LTLVGAILALAYFVLVRLVGLLTGRGAVSQPQLENAVLRHQVRVLRRTIADREIAPRAVSESSHREPACERVYRKLGVHSRRRAAGRLLGRSESDQALIG